LEDAVAALNAHRLNHLNGARIHNLDNVQTTVQGALQAHKAGHPLPEANVESYLNKAFEFLYTRPNTPKTRSLFRQIAYDDGYDAALEALKDYKP
jgi:glutamyl-tRNA reductase